MDLPIDEEIFKTYDSVVLDGEGFIICLIHHERRYGWRSVPYTAVASQQALTAGMTPLEHERWVVWGEMPRTRPWSLTEPPEDRRDNRDPEEVYAEIAVLKGTDAFSGNSTPPPAKRDDLDANGWPKRWSDPKYLGDGPWGA